MHFLTFVVVIAIVYYIIMFILENKKEKKKKIEDINKEISLIKANLEKLNEITEKADEDILLLQKCCSFLIEKHKEEENKNDTLKQLIETISDDEHSIDESYKIDEDKREDIIDAMYKENENLKEKLSEYEKKFGKL